MNVDAESLEMLKKDGARVSGGRKPEPPKHDPMQEIVALLRDIAARKPEAPSVVEPRITVPAPVVTVNVPPAAPVRKWKFTLKKNRIGETEEIIATAEE